MEKTELVKMLRELDRELSSPFEVIIIGGAAMILHFGARRATRDVDMIVLRGNVQALREAIKRVAQTHGLTDAWMNDSAKGFADILPPDFLQL